VWENAPGFFFERSVIYICAPHGFIGRSGGLGSSTIFKNLMSPTPRFKWYLTTGRRAH